MKKNTLLVLFFLCAYSVFSQVVINELDSDTPGIDKKEFVELKSEEPFYSLDGFVLAFFNGNPNASDANKIYKSIDLTGLITDANGLVVIGNNDVRPLPTYIIEDNTIQNGPDAIAIYRGVINDYGIFTLATTDNLIDALAYSNNSSQIPDLLNLLGLNEIYNENQHRKKDLHSIQRKDDGSYEVKEPTPGVLNDGNGILFNGIEIIPQDLSVSEGDSFDITFKTTSTLTESLTIHYTLENGNFNDLDFTGDLSVTIPANNDSATTTIQILNDGLEEGDEEMKITIINFPNDFIAINNNVIIRVSDANFTQSLWGTPLNPTFGVVSSTQSENYYASLDGKSGEELKNALQDIIADPNVVRKYTYGDVTTILKDVDQNPENNDQVWLIYLESGRSKKDFQTTSSSVGKWNREHIFPQSRGKFSGGTSGTAVGIDGWEHTDADDLLAGHSDVHHIRAADGPENSRRGNKSFGPGGYEGVVGNSGSWKGDVARALFYMAIRYNDLDVERGFLPTTTNYKMGDLDVLLEWNREDTADDFEMNRNNIIYEWQQNRNPFIDFPELADYIWGNRIGEVWYNTLSIDNFEENNIFIYPNPATEYIYINGLNESSNILIYSTTGQKVLETYYESNSTLPINLAKGLYFVKIINNQGVETRKLIVK